MTGGGLEVFGTVVGGAVGPMVVGGPDGLLAGAAVSLPLSLSALALAAVSILVSGLVSGFSVVLPPEGSSALASLLGGESSVIPFGAPSLTVVGGVPLTAGASTVAPLKKLRHQLITPLRS